MVDYTDSVATTKVRSLVSAYLAALPDNKDSDKLENLTLSFMQKLSQVVKPGYTVEFV